MKQFCLVFIISNCYTIFPLVSVSKIRSGFNVYITTNMASNLTSDSGTWCCDICNYTSSRRSNFERHEKSTAHKHLLQFNECELQECEQSNEIENEEIDSCSDFYQTEKEHSADQNTEYLKCTGINQSNKTSSEENNELPNSELPTNDTCAWYPFSSQVDFYLYVLVNSTTHPVVSNILLFN